MKKKPDCNPLPVPETADELFSIEDRPEQTIEIPEWGFSVVVREPDAKTTIALQKGATDKDGNYDIHEFRFRFVLESIIKPKTGIEHLERLKGKSNRAFLRLLNSIGKKKED